VNVTVTTVCGVSNGGNANGGSTTGAITLTNVNQRA
jgi:hypothetical protein